MTARTFSLGASELTRFNAHELGLMFAKRRASPVDVAQAVLANIERSNPVLNAFCYLDRERTLQEAKASEARWMRQAQLSPYDGVPFGVKDMIAVCGVPTGFGSKAAWTGEPSAVDAPSVARLREAGCVFVGKTTTSEFGWKGTADNPLTGRTVNIRNPRLTSGGSSGGAACAAVGGMGVFQLGTDGGGSARIPASFCGGVGMKATFGRVPAWPAGPMMSLSNIGPMARSIRDLESLFSIVSQGDARDWNAVPRPLVSRSRATALSGLRCGVHLDSKRCDPEVDRIVRKAVDALAAEGVVIVERPLPLTGARELIEKHWQAGTAWLVSRIPPDRADLVDPGLREVALRGRDLPLATYYDAMVGRQQFGEAMTAHLADLDFAISPTVPVLPFGAGRDTPEGAEGDGWLGWNPYTYPFNLTRHPAISLPAGTSADELPVGMQLVGKLYEDEWLLQLAGLVEEALSRSQA
ncbi:MAG TPA: amidase [Pseudorhodoferax sp.]|nr:amidase [Pseudorhodoferax sp.]